MRLITGAPLGLARRFARRLTSERARIVIADVVAAEQIVRNRSGSVGRR